MHPMKRLNNITHLLFLSSLAGLLLLSSPCPAPAAESRCYRQQTGEQVSWFAWDYAPTSGYLETRDRLEQYRLWSNADLATRRWQLNNPAGRTRIEVERRDNTLVWTGLIAGEAVNRTEQIDSAPWFQALSLSLQSLLENDCQSVDFWMVRPDTLELHKLQASRKGWSRPDWAHGNDKVLQVRVTVPGIPSFIWHSDYWLDADGRFLRFQGKTGLVGNQMTIVELLDDQASSACTDLPLDPEPSDPCKISK